MKIQYPFIPIPNYFFENGLIDEPVYGQFIHTYFYKARRVSHTEVFGHREITLEPHEFIFGRIKFSKRFGFTERQVRTVVDNLKKSGILLDTGKGIKNHYSILVWNVSKFGSTSSQKRQVEKRPTKDQPEISQKQKNDTQKTTQITSKTVNTQTMPQTNLHKVKEQTDSHRPTNDHKAEEREKSIETTTKPPSLKSFELPNTIPKVVDFFICLADKKDLTIQDKLRLMQYPEEKVSQAIDYAYHPKIKIKKTRMHAIVYAIKNDISSAQECDPMTRLAIDYNNKVKEYGCQNVYKTNLECISKGYIHFIEHGRWNQMSLGAFNEDELKNACREIENLIESRNSIK